MLNQLRFQAFADNEAWSGWLEAIREVVRGVGHKEASFALDLAGSDLSHALAERNRYELKARHLPKLLSLRQSDVLPQLIADHCGLEFAAKRELTAAEKLERLEAAILRCGPAGAAVLADAYGRRR